MVVRKPRFLDWEQYLEALENQDGLCAICLEVPDSKNAKRRKRNLCEDHDHNTGLFRGLICDRCNMALGMFRDSVMILESALRYLKRPL